MTDALVPTERLSTAMHKARLFPGIANSEGAMAVILAGKELGFGPIASLTGIHLIKGKVTLSASLMAAAIRRSGTYDYRVMEHTDQVCRIEFTYKGQAAGVSEFTWQHAVTAGLATGDNWKKFARNMLFARAMSNGAKWYCPDVFAGQPVYTEDELEGEAVEAEWTPSPTPSPESPAAAASPTSSTSPAAWTLDQLIDQYGAERVVEAAGGIPATVEELAVVAAKLAGGADAS